MGSSDFRREARAKLAGKWGKAILISFVYLAIVSAIELISNFIGKSIPLIFSIVTLLIEIPLTFGLICSFLKLYNNEEVRMFDFITAGFSNFKRAWGVTLNIVLKMLLPILAIIAVYILSTAFLTASIMTSGLAGFGIMGIISIIAILAVTIWVAAKAYYYSLAIIIAAEDSSISSKEAVQKSEQLMKGNRGKLFCLQLSFIGWILLGAIITFFIGLIIGLIFASNALAIENYVISVLTVLFSILIVPYMQCATIAFYNFVNGKN